MEIITSILTTSNKVHRFHPTECCQGKACTLIMGRILERVTACHFKPMLTQTRCALGKTTQHRMDCRIRNIVRHHQHKHCSKGIKTKHHGAHRLRAWRRTESQLQLPRSRTRRIKQHQVLRRISKPEITRATIIIQCNNTVVIFRPPCHKAIL